MAKTFENDEALPSLPLPDLSQTLEHYLESVRPCVDDNEFEKTVQIVKEFQDGDGHILQEELKRRSESKRNWVSAVQRNISSMQCHNKMFASYS